MSNSEKKLILENMRKRTKKATSSKAEAVKYLIELGALTPNGNYKKRYRPTCFKSPAA